MFELEHNVILKKTAVWYFTKEGLIFIIINHLDFRKLEDGMEYSKEYSHFSICPLLNEEGKKCKQVTKYIYF